MVDCLIADTVDGIVVDTDSAVAYIQTYPELVMTEFAQGQGFKLDYTGACIGIRKQDTDLKEKVNAALATIDDTTRQTLMDEATQRMPQ